MAVGMSCCRLLPSLAAAAALLLAGQVSGASDKCSAGSVEPHCRAEVEPLPDASELDYELDTSRTTLNTPYGGTLLDLMAPAGDVAGLKKEAADYPSLVLNLRQVHDVEMLLVGAFSPLTGFMNQTTYDSVVKEMRLPNGMLWPLPVNLDVSQATAKTYTVGQKVALRDEYFNLVALLTVTSMWEPNKAREAGMVYDTRIESASQGTPDKEHPAIRYALEEGTVYVGGDLLGVALPSHHDFRDLRRTPAQLRALLEEHKTYKVVAFQTRNPMHRAHIELARRAGMQLGAVTLIHPVVGPTKPGDVAYVERVACYKAVLASGKYFRSGRAVLSLLPLAMRMAGPREALLHAIVRKNFGASHFIVGRDHAGCKRSKALGDGDDFYTPFEAQDLVLKHASELGIEIVQFPNMVYTPADNKYHPHPQVADQETLAISGTKFRKMLEAGDPIPAWFSDPAVMDVLYKAYPPKLKRGFTLFFEGLSGSGKTTISQALLPRLTELESASGSRRISTLDGDVVRTHLSKGLGFTKDDRLHNIKRIGYVSAEISKHKGIAVAVAISPYESARHAARDMVNSAGGSFIEIFVNATVDTCTKRDVKGLYEKARLGLIKMTGVNDPFEAPTKADLVLDGNGEVSVEENVELVLQYLHQRGFIEHVPVL